MGLNGFSRIAAMLLFLILMAAAPGVRAGVTISYDDGGQDLFRFDVPDFWTMRAGGRRSVTPPGSEEARLINRVIGLHPQTEEGVWIGFMSPNGVRTYDEGVAYLRDIGSFILTDAKVTSESRVQIGGRPTARFVGTGRRNGRVVSFTALLIDLPGSRVAISLVVLEAGVDAGYVNDVNAVLSSFRAIN